MAFPASASPSPDDVNLARAALPVLSAYLAKGRMDLRLVGIDDAEHAAIELPPAVLDIVQQILEEFAQGHAVMLNLQSRELTTQQAAELLMVSRPHVIKLLDAGEITYRMVGSHRRVDLESLLAYRDRTTRRSREALRTLTELAEDMGGYDD